MQIEKLIADSRSFLEKMRETKVACAGPDFPWYPWGTIHNLGHLNNLLTGSHRDLATLIGEMPVADVGAADGDLAFFLEQYGVHTDIIDFGPTNHNGLRGARALKDALHSQVSIYEMDLDGYFKWPRERYGLVFFLGILYHLKNPFYALESLAKVAEHALISTKIARFSSDKKTLIENQPVAYLLDTGEAHNDPTNYWVFSDAGLKRILNRTGWELLDYARAGNTKKSDPASPDGDERAFFLVRSKLNGGSVSIS
jgi:2-polyprenyl-3-methyl-5-hydroxy-6-metoxy-1,4-benzoquinol methylase